jgi:GxxExxY protein
VSLDSSTFSSLKDSDGRLEKMKFTPTSVISICNRIYKQLGISHNECVYQKALVLELYNAGAESVESEKNVPVFYIDVNEITHTIGTERVDILFRSEGEIHLLELKATTTTIRDNIEVQQLRKYKEALLHMNIVCNHMYVVNFRQNSSNDDVNFVYFDDKFQNCTESV